MVHVGRFLSPGWLAELEAAAASDERLRHAARGMDLTIGHHVDGGPAGPVDYRMVISNGEVRVEPGPGDADVVVYQEYGTAAAISRGELTPAAAFGAGRVRLAGRPGRLARHREALGTLGDVFAALRDRTTY